MTKYEIMRYVIMHEGQPIGKMAKACKKSEGFMRGVCEEMGVEVVTKNPDIPRVDLAVIEQAIEEDDLPEDDPRDWEDERKRKELDDVLEPYLKQGYSRFQSIQILSEVADYLVNIPDPDRPRKHHKAEYSNPSREQLIDKILSHS
jgi:hypothetical protein